MTGDSVTGLCAGSTDQAVSGSFPTDSATGFWTSTRVLWLNVFALSVLLVAMLSLLGNGSIAVYDEAVYAAQAQALVDGSWVSPRSASVLDPEGLANPLLDSKVVAHGVIPYSRHPLYPVLLVPLTAIGGYSASILMSVVGVVLAAVCAAFLARRVDARYGVPALWLAGVASPLVVDAVVLWAHGLAAATAGFAFLSALRLVDGRRIGLNVLGVASAATATVMLRTEGVIFVGVVGLVFLGRSIKWRAPTAPNFRMAALGFGLGGLGLLAYVVDGWWSRRIGGSGGYGTDVSTGLLGSQAGPVDALWNSVLRPGREMMLGATPILTGSTVFLALGALAVRFRLPWRSVPWGLSVLGAAGWVWALVAMSETGTFFVTGLLPAFPALLLTFIVIGSPELRRVELSTAVAVVVIALGVSLLFIHRDGGTEWGGRFFHLLLVPAIAPILAVADRTRRYFNTAERRLLVVPVAILLLVPSASALRFVGTRRFVVEQQVDELVRRLQPDVGGDHVATVIVWTINRDGTARQFWEQRTEVDLLAPRDGQSLVDLLNTAELVARGEALLVTDSPIPIVNLLLGSNREGASWYAEESKASRGGLLMMIPLRLER